MKLRVAEGCLAGATERASGLRILSDFYRENDVGIRRKDR
jgi:hypothetical protein